MITRQDLDSAIAECQGKRNPDANTCIKLAAFLTIRRELYGEGTAVQHSYAPAPEDRIYIGSDSDFARLVDGMRMEDFLPIMDELMSTLQIVYPRLYNAVMDKLS